MTEQQITDGWREANIARVLAEMKRYGLTLADLAEADRMPAMVNITRTSTPNQPNRNTVAGE